MTLNVIMCSFPLAVLCFCCLDFTLLVGRIEARLSYFYPRLHYLTGYDQALSANEPVKTTNQPEPSGRTDPPPAKVSEALDTSPTNNSRHKPEAITKTDVNGKNERGKVKDPDFQRHRVSENTKVPKDLKFEGKGKMGNHRSSSEMLRKSIKRIGIGNNSGKGHLAVGVAS